MGNFDHQLRSVAFTYDNSLALLAFLAEGSADGLRRARLIGDAFIHAASHDRALVNGELRSAYATGRLTLPNGWEPNGIADEIRFAGFYNAAASPIPAFEELFTTNISLGNTAWPMTALLALYRETFESKYLNAARDLGEFILQFHDVTCTFGGFTGGVKNISPAELETFHSVEHNIDIYAAFSLMYDITGEQTWLDNAQHAKNFVFAMWTGAPLNCLYPGTEGGSSISCNPNMTPNQNPLDVHPWAVLAIPDTLNMFPEVLQCAFLNHAVTCPPADLAGFDFNNDRDAVWFEGTAHMALALALAGFEQDAELYRQTLSTAQATLPSHRSELRGPLVGPIGLVAACTDGATTGFGFLLFERLHIGATAWNVFAQLGFNPYYQTTVAFTE